MKSQEIQALNNNDLVNYYELAMTNSVKAANCFGKSKKLWSKRSEQVKEEILKRMK